MANIFIDNAKLIGDIATAHGCNLDTAAELLYCDLKNGKSINTDGMIPTELLVAAQKMTPAELADAKQEYRAWELEHYKMGEKFDPSDWQ